MLWLIIIALICVIIYLASTRKKIERLTDVSALTDAQKLAYQEKRREEIRQQNKAAQNRFYVTIALLIVGVLAILIGIRTC
jgi:uncharacterized ion transporter superfamily protein YfcC